MTILSNVPEGSAIVPDSACGGDSSPHTLAMLVAYDGLPFAGFAAQPGQATVQSTLEAALEIAVRRKVRLAVAGRTDSGVHAMGQVVSFEATGDEPPPDELKRSLNALMGDGVIVRDIRRARPGFSARFDAKAREYRYRISTQRVQPLFTSHVTWWLHKDLDVGAMRRAAALLLGERDFKSFCLTASAEGKPTHRRLDAIDFTLEEHLGEPCVTVRVEANAFLHSMVRVLVGTLVDVGAGRRDVEWVGRVLEARERSAAGPTAPAHGLTLWSVSYLPEVWLDGGFEE